MHRHAVIGLKLLLSYSDSPLECILLVKLTSVAWVRYQTQIPQPSNFEMWEKLILFEPKQIMPDWVGPTKSESYELELRIKPEHIWVQTNTKINYTRNGAPLQLPLRLGYKLTSQAFRWWSFMFFVATTSNFFRPNNEYKIVLECLTVSLKTWKKKCN